MEAQIEYIRNLAKQYKKYFELSIPDHIEQPETLYVDLNKLSKEVLEDTFREYLALGARPKLLFKLKKPSEKLYTLLRNPLYTLLQNKLYSIVQNIHSGMRYYLRRLLNNLGTISQSKKKISK